MPETKKKPPVKRYTQEEVEAMIRQAYKDAGSPLPSLANRRKMMEQMTQTQMDRQMRAAAKKRGVPMNRKVKK